jgi:flagellar biosynthetic protein FliQ
MELGDVVTLMQEAIKTLLMLLAPLLGAGLTVGVLVSLFQATIQLNEQSMPFTFKMVAVFGALFISGMWIIETLVRFTTELYQSIPTWM